MLTSRLVNPITSKFLSSSSCCRTPTNGLDETENAGRKSTEMSICAEETIQRQSLTTQSADEDASPLPNHLNQKIFDASRMKNETPIILIKEEIRIKGYES